MIWFASSTCKNNSQKPRNLGAINKTSRQKQVDGERITMYLILSLNTELLVVEPKVLEPSHTTRNFMFFWQ